MLHRISFPDPLEGVLFDLEGTLVDTRDLPWRATQRVLGEFGIGNDRVIPRPSSGISEESYWETLRDRFELDPPVADLVARRTRFLLEDLGRVALRPLPGVPELLRQLEAHHVERVAVSRRPRRELEALLRSSGLDRWFLRSYSAHDDRRRGFHPASLQVEAARHFGFDPRRCIAIEDSARGVRAALAASMFVVAVPSEDPTSSDYSKAHVRVSSLRLLAPAFGAA